MTALTVVCDRCDEPAGPDRTRLEATLGPAAKSWQPSPLTARPIADLCASCAEDLMAWLSGRAGGFTLATTGAK